MMESNFYSDDFERLIREKTEQYKMYPSEKVWKGVYSSLHTKKRWFIGGMFILVTGIIVVAGRELIMPAAHTGPLKKQPLTASLTTPKVTPENTVLPAPFAEFRGGNHSAAFTHSSRVLGPLEDASATTDEIGGAGAIDPATGQQPDPAYAMGQTPDIGAASGALTAVPAVSVKGSSRMEASGSAGSRAANHAGSSNTTETRPADTYASYLARVRTGNGLAFGPDPYEGQLYIVTFASVPGNIPGPGLQISLHPAVANRSMSRVRSTDLFQPVSADDDEDELMASDTTIDITRQKINWLQDYAVYSMHPSPRKNKAYWQIYIAPTENVRMVSGGNSFNPKSDPTATGGTAGSQPAPANVKTPAGLLQNIGFEAGGAFLYRLSRTVSVKAGLQFNYSRLSFNTHSGGPAGAASSSAPNGNFGGPIDSSGNLAGASSASGPSRQILHDEYFQLSAPVGLEFRLWGNDRLQVNFAATVQPAYLLNTNAFQMAAESKDFIKSPALFRKWNVDGGAEAYLSYKIGGLHLQAGPEFRYQFLSSYSGQYPLRENLASYGLKIGITKAIR
jgi:hypothetical protein